MNNTELFLDLYKQLEQSAVLVYGFPSDGTAVSRLERVNQFKTMKSELKYCREVRALLVHNPRINGDFAVVPSDSMIEMLKSIILRIHEPPTCYEKSIKGSNILSANPDDLIFDKMKIMKAFGYSYVPIMKNGRVVGVFGKDTIFILTLAGTDELLNKKTVFKDIAPYTSLSRNDKNTFKFVPACMYLADAERLVVDAFKNKERVNLIFVTENGSPDEHLLGILTPWDVMDS